MAQTRISIKPIIKITSIILLAGILILIGFFTYFFCKTDFNPEDLTTSKASVSVLDVFGKELIAENRYVTFENIDRNLINAFVALEDKRFYKHNGLDYLRIIGAMKNNIKAGYLKEGGSTITQQLAKNSLLTNEKSFIRKIKEARLAVEIEKRLSKEEIIEQYLNTVYFSHGIYGVHSACKCFFNKSPSEVLPYEAAILAGIVKNPKRNSPYNSPQNANSRKDLVLRLMYEQGFITDKEYAEGKEIYFIPNKQNKDKDISASYYSAVIDQAADILGISEKELMLKDYQINTYYEDEVQKELFLEENGDSLTDNSVIVLDNSTCGVSAYLSTHNNSVFDFRRQPASAIKPILVYAPALSKGYYSSSMFFDERKEYSDGYSPSNYKNQSYGWIDARTALSESVNTVAVDIFNDIGIETGKQYAERMGIPFSKYDNNLALALGGMTNGVTITELSQAYMSFANGGIYNPCSFISSIKTKDGISLYRHTLYENRVISEENAYLITDMLKTAAKTGTARKLNDIGFEVAAKTGTGAGKTNNIDAWSVAYTSRNTVCVWYGDLSNSNGTTITGGSTPTLLVRSILKSLPEPVPFLTPSGIVELEIDGYTQKEYKEILLASPNTPKEYRIKELFSSDNAPIEFSTVFENNNLFFYLSRENGGIRLDFDANRFFEYSIMKTEGLWGKERKIADIKNQNGHVYVIDNDLNRGNLIVGYYIISKNKLGYETRSEEKYRIIHI